MQAPEFWNRGHSVIPKLLTPLAYLYRMGAKWRERRALPYQAKVPVVCVGNLVMGGAGKTPTAIALARYFQSKNLCVHFLSKGYKGAVKGPTLVDLEKHTAADVGDEPLLLAEVAPTFVSKNRVDGAMEIEKAGVADVIIMDDGYQNPTLVKELSILVMDQDFGVGNGHTFPAGPLREPVEQGMKRASAVILIGTLNPTAAKAKGAVRTQTGRLLLRAHLEPQDKSLKGQRVVAFAGIGRPAKFAKTLEDMGAEVMALHSFPDHHAYTAAEVSALLAEAEHQGALLATTTKDAVKVPQDLRKKLATVPVDLVFEQPELLDEVFKFLIMRAAVPSTNS